MELNSYFLETIEIKIKENEGIQRDDDEYDPARYTNGEDDEDSTGMRT